jgi:hypothetical protein
MLGISPAIAGPDNNSSLHQYITDFHCIRTGIIPTGCILTDSILADSILADSILTDRILPNAEENKISGRRSWSTAHFY